MPWLNTNLDQAVVSSPGLVQGWRDIFTLAEGLRKRIRILLFKAQVPALWAVVLGGTGTGKSTLFNVLCGKTLSETGVERPKTSGPILYTHEGSQLASGVPFANTEARSASSQQDPVPTAGLSGRILVLEHRREELRHLILADTPDLDSVELENRRIAEDLYHLSDAVIFVTSQEKYADEVPHLYLLKVLKDQRLCYLILNKAEASSTREDVLSTLQETRGLLPRDHVWLFPYMPNQPAQALAHHPAFRDFQALFMKELSRTRMPDLRRKLLQQQRNAFQEMLARFTAILKEEQTASARWLEQLRRLGKKSSEGFLREQTESFSSKSMDVLKGEIRKLFSKYDILAKPREAIREALLAPLRLVGILEKRDTLKHQEDLRRVRQKMDLVPIQAAVEKFNRLVLEELSPPDEDAPLYNKLRDPETALTAEEVKSLVWKAQDQLEEWLADRFERLTKSLPRTKRWGIHTTSVLWGVLIVAFEIAIGGGFTLVDAILGSALAPFVTKGAVELFAYHEIQQITRGLAERYKEGMLSVIHAQQERYENCIKSLMMPNETRDTFQELGLKAAQFGGDKG